MILKLPEPPGKIPKIIKNHQENDPYDTLNSQISHAGACVARRAGSLFFVSILRVTRRAYFSHAPRVIRGQGGASLKFPRK